MPTPDELAPRRADLLDTLTRRPLMSFPVHLLALLLSFGAPAAPAAGPCVSGPKPGQRPGPYSAIVSVGDRRGQSHCYICETEDRPAAIVFARSLSAPLARLVRGLDKAVADHKGSDLRAWVTLLHDDQSAFDPQVMAWAKKEAIRNVPLAVFEDVGGPPSYRLHRDADVTVLLFVKQKVVRNFAFRAGELTDAQVAEVLRAVPAILPAGKKK
jgi:hypothetical protein